MVTHRFFEDDCSEIEWEGWLVSLLDMVDDSLESFILLSFLDPMELFATDHFPLGLPTTCDLPCNHDL